MCEQIPASAVAGLELDSQQLCQGPGTVPLSTCGAVLQPFMCTFVQTLPKGTTHSSWFWNIKHRANLEEENNQRNPTGVEENGP